VQPDNPQPDQQNVNVVPGATVVPPAPEQPQMAPQPFSPNPTMTPSTGSTPEQPQQGKGKKKLLIIVGVVIALLIVVGTIGALLPDSSTPSSSVAGSDEYKLKDVGIIAYNLDDLKANAQDFRLSLAVVMLTSQYLMI